MQRRDAHRLDRQSGEIALARTRRVDHVHEPQPLARTAEEPQRAFATGVRGLIRNGPKPESPEAPVGPLENLRIDMGDTQRCSAVRALRIEQSGQEPLAPVLAGGAWPLGHLTDRVVVLDRSVVAPAACAGTADHGELQTLERLCRLSEVIEQATPCGR